jgi:hypothetical protein
MSNNPTNTDSNKDKDKRTRGAFPRLPLADVIELPKTIFELGQGRQVRRLRVFQELKKSPNSSTSRMLITTSNSYGLTSGGYNAEFLEITNRGKEIVGASAESSKYRAIYDALFSNDIFSKFMAEYNQKRVPDDTIAIDYFQHDQGLSLEDAKICWQVIKSNISAYGLIQDVAGRKTIISREMALERLSDEARPEPQTFMPQASSEQDGKQSRTNAQLRAMANSGIVTPQIHFNIQVVIPENASPETYDAIFKSIAVHLLGRTDE